MLINKKTMSTVRIKTRVNPESKEDGMENKLIRDFVYGAIGSLFALFAWLYMIPHHIKGKVSILEEVQLMPRLAVALFGIASLVLLVTSFRKLGLKGLIEGFTHTGFNLPILAKQAAFLGITFFFIGSIERFGFILSSFFYVFIALTIMGRRDYSVRRLLRNTILSAVFTGIAFSVFSMVFKVSLPL